MTDSMKPKIDAFFNEFGHSYLGKEWQEYLMSAGISEKDAGLWAVEIWQVVDEFHSRLLRLDKLIQDTLHDTDVERIQKRVYYWVAGTLAVTPGEIEEPMRYLQGELEKTLPPDPDDDD